MTVDQNLLRGSQSREWTLQKSPIGVIPKWIYTGRDESGLGPIYVGLATVTSPPTRESMRALHAAYKGRQNFQLVVGAVSGDQIWIFGPDERTEITGPLEIEQGCRQLQSALDEPDAIAAYTRLGQFRRSLDTTSLLGVTNSGLFASYHIRENVPKRNDWESACERSKQLLGLRNEPLINALGFKSERTAGNALLLSANTTQTKAVAILLDETEQFDASSSRHTGISPVAFGLNVATRQGVPWLFVLRKDQIRIYPAKDGIGVGQKGQVETYLEIDLSAIDSKRAGLLTLIFSAEALEQDGTTNELLQGSQLFASKLGNRLRERIYEHVVPQLSKSVAEHLREQGTKLDSAGLSLAYRLTLRILFRLLFQAYAEDRGLLPAGRNEGYDANSLKTIAKRIINNTVDQFGKSKTLWFDLVQVWDAIDEGNETWNVPAYNGGLFGKDSELHPEGALIEKLGIQDDILGPVLQHLLLDISEDNVLGPVDFRSLSVREFGTIYEGLLESSLSLANNDLTVDLKGSWVPALKNDQVLAKKGDVYFHSSSGERKATGSYFTPGVVVDHLIERSLDPALDLHLERIKKHLDRGDNSAAARDFFDFRVADLAMGSGHFLVAAIDRIETKMRTFLAEKETQVAGIQAELLRLAHSAKIALGNDESAIGEIEPSALLRRQIARRCIYGLDINPLSVELSKLAIWIHTFVPGLPMSSLDHGLVCANSLTGIGTIEEAIEALLPDHSGISLKPGQFRSVSLYENVIIENLEKAKDLLIESANSDEASKAEVKEASIAALNARIAAKPGLDIFNAAVAARLGLLDTRSIFDEEKLIEVSKGQDIQDAIKRINPAHFPYLFPEVFMRDKSGFDVLLGNPPWEKLHIEEHQWWGLHIPGLRGMKQIDHIRVLESYKETRPDLIIEFEDATKAINDMRAVISKGPYPGLGAAHIDLYQAFAWRNWQLINQAGYIAIVLPRGALSGSGLREWRETVLGTGTFKNVCFLMNTGGWIFEGVDGRYTIGLTVITKSNDHSVNFCGPFISRIDMINGREDLVHATKDEFKSWSGSLAFPLIPNSKSESVFKKMKKQPRFDDSRSGFEFKPLQGDINATTDKALLEFDTNVSKNRIPVIGGSSFNLWNPNFGPPYAYAEETVIRKFLFEKVKSSSRNVRSAYYGLTEFSEANLPFDSPRIVFRDISNQTNTRTVICSLIPGGTICTHKSPVLVRKIGNEADEAYLLAIMSSIIYDWYMRRWVELHLTFELLNPSPIPQITNSILRNRLVEISVKLSAVDERFETWANLAGITPNYRLDENEKANLIYELDAIVAKLYELDENELKHIFVTFHRGWDYKERMDRTVSYFQELNV